MVSTPYGDFDDWVANGKAIASGVDSLGEWFYTAIEAVVLVKFSVYFV
jgi:hypothetical protein